MNEQQANKRYRHTTPGAIGPRPRFAALALCFFATSALAQDEPALDVVPPEVLAHVDAVYPPAALRERKHADVVLTVTVDVDGHVSNVEIAESGGADLDEAAIVAMRQWTFRPALRDGKALASRIHVPFHFAPPAPPPEIVESSPQPAPHVAPPPAVPGAAPSAPAEREINEVRISGRREVPSRGASDFRLPIGQLAQVPRANASDVLKLAPGILLSNEGGDGHAEQVFLRGFDAREGQDIEFSVDGVPINESGNLHGNGYADTHFIIPELIDSLRVVEGPFDPRQGNYAVAGSANYELGLRRRGLTAKYTGGSWGTERTLLLYGPPGESTRTFGGAELFHSSGYGQNRDSDRATAMGQYEGRAGESGSFRLTATAYSTKYHSAGIIREDDYLAGRIGFYDTYDPRQGGSSSRYSIAGSIEATSGNVGYEQQVFLIAREMRLLENFTGYLLDVQTPLQNPHMQRGDLLDLDVSETTLGARGHARWSDDVFGQKQGVEMGYFARGDRAEGMQQRLQSPGTIPYHTDTNLESNLADLGLYGDLDLHAATWLTLRGGARADLFTFDVQDRCAVHDVSQPSPANPPGDASCLDQQRFGVHRETNQRSTTASTALLPRASVLIGPFYRLSATASYGLGVRSIDPIYISQDIPTPFASVKAYEAGLLYAGGVGDIEIVARSIVFQTHVDKDLIFDQTVGRNTLANGTTRTGWVGAVRATGSFFDEAANITVVKSTFDDTHLLVPYVPDVVVRSDSALFADVPWVVGGAAPRASLGAGISYVGRRPLPFSQRSQAIFTVDPSGTVTWRPFELGLAVTNLVGSRYRLGEYNFASTFTPNAAPDLVSARQFTAGPPRGIFASFAVTLGGKS